MNLNSAGRLQLVFSLSIGLLSLLPLSECEQIRLVGPSRCSGRVEVFHMNTWGTVCDDQWTIINAEVVCRELGCGTVLDAKKSAFFGEGKNQIWLDDVQCTGSETSILKCAHKPLGVNNCGHSEDAGVICSDHLKVVNGSHRCNGRVEAYTDGQWKRMCNSDWGKEEADVVCQEMNCGTSIAQTDGAYFGEAQDLPEIKATCVGNETSISNCHLEEFREHCVDATVLCSNTKPIRLINGTNRCNGRVEVFYSGQWGTICDDRWGMPEARVTCRETNCGSPLSVKYKAFYGRGSDQVWLDDVECFGHEKSLSDCPHRAFGEHDCDHSEDAGVECSENLRLINGTDRCSGRLEIFHNNQWVKVCNSYWDLNRAKMVCQELDCGAPKTAQSTNYGFSKLTGYSSTCGPQATTLSQCTFQEVTVGCEDVSVSCAGNPPLRLVNGTDRCSGRVEVLHDSMWGTVCDDDWDINEAQVVCRALDCGTAISAKSMAHFGQGQGDVWLDDMRCVGNETSLLHCPHPSLGNSNCGHAEDAGVVCSATIRLINGTNQCSGKLEYHRGDRWSPAFYVNWGMNEARTVCREMACGDPVQTTGMPGQGGNQRGLKIICSGRESVLGDCQMRDYVSGPNEVLQEVYVECTGNVRLAGGSNRCAGRVEFFDKGQWGKICGENWDVNDAAVVCRQLGCGKAHKITTLTEHGEGPAQTWIDILQCNGMESTLAQCSQMQFSGDRTCNTTSIAGVICAGSLAVRFTNAEDCSGRVEVRHGDVWKTVCDADWTLSKAEVVCQHLECGHAISAPGSAHFGQGTGLVVEPSNNCFDNGTSLQRCSVSGYRSSSCGHDHDAGAVCAAPVRLVDGGGTCSGRVEIFFKGTWGTVCDDEWEMPNADVVCRQMGCGHAVSAPMSAHFGRGSGPIWLDNVECRGQESALSECRHAGVGSNNCGHGEDASAICLGALEKPQITLRPGPEVSFGDKVEITCTIVTEHLGGTFVLKRSQDAFKLEKYSENEAATFNFFSVTFDQRGSYFCEYQKKMPNQVINYPQGNPADLSVTVKLETPSISLTSPHAMVVYSPDKISVNNGNSFSVTCSIHSRYPGGVFYLTLNNKTSQMKTAFGHTIFYLAYFEFPHLDLKDQGDYTCIYGVNISSRSFSSAPSKLLQVTVLSASSSSVVAGVVIGLLLLVVAGVIAYFAWKRSWRPADAMVQFMNRFGETIKHDDVDDRSNGLFDGRDRTKQVTEQPQTRVPQEKIVEVDADNPAERVPEDLAGRVCYELEPLVFS